MSRLLSALLPFLLLLAESHAQNSDSRIKITLETPAGRTARKGFPLPLFLQIDSKLSAFAGVAQIATAEAQPRVLAERPITIGPGSFQFELNPIMPGDVTAISINLYHDSGALVYHAERLLDYSLRPHSMVLLAARAENLTAVHSQLTPAVSDIDPMHPRRMTLRVATSDLQQGLPGLPSRWTAIAMFSAVFWDGNDEPRLSAEQRDALTNWVIMGGHLIIAPDAGALETPSPVPLLAPSPFPVLAAGSEPISASHGAGLISQLPPGSFHSIGAQQLRDLVTRSAPPEVLVPGEEDSSSHRDDGRWLERTAQQSLARAVGYAEHSFIPILIFGLVYILTLAILEPLSLRALGIPWATWLTMPMVTLLFCFLAVKLFHNSSITPVGHAAIEFADKLPDGTATRMSLECVRTPAIKHPAIQIGPHELLVVDTPGQDSPYTVGGIGTSMQLAITEDGMQTAVLHSSSTYTLLRRRSPFDQDRDAFPIIGTQNVTIQGDFLHGSISLPAGFPVALAFAYWDGWFYELDGNMRVVRRSMRADDRQLIQRLVSRLPESAGTDNPLALSRLAEQAGRLTIVAALAHDPDHPTTELAPILPAGYGMICVITRPTAPVSSSAHVAPRQVTCYRQLFLPERQ